MHIDTAEAYGNEAEVGLAISESKMERQQLYITTKVMQGVHNIPEAIAASLKKLRVDYVDL